MAWVLGVLALVVVAAWFAWIAGPRVGLERVADADAELVRADDRARWRRVRQRTYRLWKHHDDHYRVAAFRKAVGEGLPESEARARVRKEFPIYYLDPADRDAEGFAGDDGALPVVLRERVERGARALKQISAERDAEYRTMNALIRTCLRKEAL
jgi:hypothetical protein